MKALVTGGGGFLGRWIVDRLLARGDTVRVLGRREYPDLTARGVECVRADLGAAPDKVRWACRDQDVVFHAGALAGFWGDYQRYYATNVEGTRAVIRGCQQAGVPKLVYTSSPSVVIGEDDIEGGDESLDYPMHHESPYAATKALAEREVLAADGVQGLSTCALRPHLIFGPGDNHIVPRLVQRAEAGMLMRVGPGTNKVDVCYVENAADAHLAAAERLEPGSPLCGRAYFLGQDEPVVLWDFVDRILEGVGAPPVTRGVPLWLAVALGGVAATVHRLLDLEGEPRMTPWLARELGTSHWFDQAAARRDLGYEAAVSTDEGLERFFASWK